MRLCSRVEVTRASADVVESELGDARVELHQERKGLANATSGTKDGDLGGLQRSTSATGGREKLRSDGEKAHLASRGRESPLLEEVEGLASSKHGEVSRGMKRGYRIGK